jgi:hypothetical protein
LVKECKLGEHDLSRLIEMAKIFEHPLQLIYRAGHNLIVDGVEVYHMIADAINAYRGANYFDFGYYIGEALDEVFLNQEPSSTSTPHTTPIKETIDEQAFNFLTGFFQGVGLKATHINSESLYNTIDHRGAMIYGPIKNMMKRLSSYTPSSPIDLPIWMALHEVSHVFQQGEPYLLQMGVISSESDLTTIRNYSEVFEHAPENAQKYSEDPRIANILHMALTAFNEGDARQVGRDIS